MSTITADNRVAQATSAKSDLIRKLFEWGGFGAGAILIAFGVVAIVMGFSGRATVADSLKLEKITGTPDMTPALIAKEAQAAGLTGVSSRLSRSQVRRSTAAREPERSRATCGSTRSRRHG